jgi:enoyl-CoA hydratase
MTALEYRTLVYDVRPPIVSVTLDRPRASNRVDLAMAGEIRDVCQRIREEERACVAIVTGRGEVFSSGRDPLAPPKSQGQTHTQSEWLAEWLELHRAASALAGVEIPVIAAINGDAIDHGLELALACDLRIAVEGARLGFTDLSRGVMPWDGGTQRLPRLAGRAVALEMLLTSRLMDAEEARRAGLVNMVAAPGGLPSAAEKVALEVASGAPIAARYAKETVLKGMDMTLEQGMRLEADLNVILQSTADRAEGLRSFLEKRKPEFRGE